MRNSSGKKDRNGHFFPSLKDGIRAAIKNFVSRQIAYRGRRIGALCDIPQLSRHNRSKREITAESILELDGGFCGADGNAQ